MQRFRHLILACAFAALPAFADWNCESEPGVTLTAPVYWAALPPPVRAFEKLTPESARQALAMDLAAKGYKIDVPIQVWNWDPVCTMLVRKNQGFTWVPSALEPPVYVMPGLDFPGAPKYDPAKPSPAAIKVSVDRGDFPAFDPPPPPPPKSGALLVGFCWTQTMCSVGPDGSGVAPDELVAQGGKRYKAHVSIGLMGKTIWFEPIN